MKDMVRDNSPLERELGYIFVDKTLLKRALTTEAYANEARQHGKEVADQDTLCTLGDAVLKTILVHELMELKYGSSGEITEKKIELERTSGLAVIARRLKVGDHLRLGVGQEKNGERNSSRLLAETLEGIVAAIYLDVGFKATRRIVWQWFIGEVKSK